MNKIVLLGLVGALGLSACSIVTGTAMTHPFAPQAGSATPGTGNAMVTPLSSGETATTLMLSGLRAGTTYVAHYHRQGDAAKPPCESGGGVVAGIGFGVADSSGNLTLRALVPSNAITNATYINVHTADAGGAPTDGGVTCATLRR